ncbi:cell wall elongation regulator TseB-like domain-containing protein [Ectobacillus ponti]|uniref:DUF5590 domain-containing protein n=1 Tax=Ectobacillus ponti TaxID=2961894 RepID=A0AA42BP69_9BACI|nr:DUF5590 domain-containing protein [Ectobacillus ponti]MCP8968785.1 DUF5590 domain-containing protein [Ectobacillus ponti]
MKKWVAACIATAALLAAYAMNIYNETMSQKIPGGNKAVAAAEDKAALVKVSNVDYYHGKSSYAVVQGTDDAGEEWIVFVPEGKGKTLMYMANEGISKRQARQMVTKEEQPREIINVKLGAEDETPLWVVTYIDQENRYAYYYMRFKDGKRDVTYSISQ